MKELASSRIVKCAVFALACVGMPTVSLVGCGNTAGSGIGSARCTDLAQQLLDLPGDPSDMDFLCQSFDLNIQLIDEGCVPAPPPEAGISLNDLRQSVVDAKEQLGCP